MLSLELWKFPQTQIMPMHAWQMGTYSIKHVMVKKKLFGATVLVQSPRLTEEATKDQGG